MELQEGDRIRIKTKEELPPNKNGWNPIFFKHFGNITGTITEVPENGVVIKFDHPVGTAGELDIKRNEIYVGAKHETILEKLDFAPEGLFKI